MSLIPNFNLSKRSEKQLSSNTNLRHFLQLNSSGLRLKQCQRPYSYQNCQKKLNLKGSKASYQQKKIPETISHKTSLTNSSFYVKQLTTGKNLLLFFGTFLQVLTKFHYSMENGHQSITFKSLDTFLIFLNFLRSSVLSRPATCEVSRIYHLYK